MPLVVENGREQQDNHKDDVADRKNTKSPAGEKALEIMRIGTGVVENASDKKSRKDEKQVDSGPAVCADIIEKLKKQPPVLTAAIMPSEYHRDRQGSNAIERGKASLEIDRGKMTRCRSHEY